MMYLAYVLLTLHGLVGIFLIGLILLQRGRGGGLAGAFGGMGGQSAFGTKAGDIFTRITIGVAVFWILLACVCILVVSAATKASRFTPGTADTVIKAPAGDKDNVPPRPGKADQPKGDETKPEGKKGDGAAKAEKPVGAEAKPEAANPEAPADPKEKAPVDPNENDKEKPEAPEKPENKPPE